MGYIKPLRSYRPKGLYSLLEAMQILYVIPLWHNIRHAVSIKIGTVCSDIHGT